MSRKSGKMTTGTPHNTNTNAVHSSRVAVLSAVSNHNTPTYERAGCFEIFGDCGDQAGALRWCGQTGGVQDWGGTTGQNIDSFRRAPFGQACQKTHDLHHHHIVAPVLVGAMEPDHGIRPANDSMLEGRIDNGMNAECRTSSDRRYGRADGYMSSQVARCGRAFSCYRLPKRNRFETPWKR